MALGTDSANSAPHTACCPESEKTSRWLDEAPLNQVPPMIREVKMSRAWEKKGAIAAATDRNFHQFNPVGIKVLTELLRVHEATFLDFANK